MLLARSFEPGLSVRHRCVSYSIALLNLSHVYLRSLAARSIHSSAFSCDIQVKGFKGAQYKGFKSESEALTYLEQSGPSFSLSISQHSRDILKKRQRSLQAQTFSAALSAQHASGSEQGYVHTAATSSMQTCSNASHSTRPCADPQQLYSMVATASAYFAPVWNDGAKC